MTFEDDKESAMFRINGLDRVVTFRKKKTLLNGTEVLIVIVRDTTDQLNFSESQKTLKQYNVRQTLLSANLNSSMINLHKQVEE